MNCPVCGCEKTTVSHTDDIGPAITRRRRCTAPRCGHRFVTRETVEADDLGLAAQLRKQLPEVFDALEAIAELVKRPAC